MSMCDCKADVQETLVEESIIDSVDYDDDGRIDYDAIRRSIELGQKAGGFIAYLG